MSVKTYAVLFRNLLYVKEVARAGSIRLAAERNNIKASNLSKIIGDTEEMFHQTLFRRTAHGVIATQKAVELSSQIEKMVQNLFDLKQKFLRDEGSDHLRIYVSKGLEIDDLSDFSQTAEYTDVAESADVIVSIDKPQKASQMVCVEHKIGSIVKQTIWICARNNPNAMNLAAFIVLKLRG